jgi:hypothetical protein
MFNRHVSHAVRNEAVGGVDGDAGHAVALLAWGLAGWQVRTSSSRKGSESVTYGTSAAIILNVIAIINTVTSLVCADYTDARLRLADPGWACPFGGHICSETFWTSRRRPSCAGSSGLDISSYHDTQHMVHARAFLCPCSA